MPFQPVETCRRNFSLDFRKQARLADPGLTDDAHNAPLPGEQALNAIPQRRKLCFPTHQSRPEALPFQATQRTWLPFQPFHLKCPYRLALALDLDLTEGLPLEHMLDEPVGLGRDLHCAWPGGLLHARR